MTNNEHLRAILELVTSNDADLDIDTFIKSWPDDLAAQALITAALLAKNSRDLNHTMHRVDQLARNVSRRDQHLWLGLTLALGMSVLAVASVLRVDLTASLVLALSSGLMAQAVKLLTGARG